MYKHWAGLILVESRMHVPTTCPTNWLCVIACAGWWCGGTIVYMFVLCTCFSCDVSCSDVWSSCICRHNHKHDLKMLAPHQVYPAPYSWLDLHFKVLVFDKQHEYKTTEYNLNTDKWKTWKICGSLNMFACKQTQSVLFHKLLGTGCGHNLRVWSLWNIFVFLAFR